MVNEKGMVGKRMMTGLLGVHLMVDLVVVLGS